MLGGFFELLFVLAALAFLVPLGEVGNARPLADQFDEGFGHVARVLLALVAVEELDEVPGFALGARSERCFAGRDRLRADDDEVAEGEADFAFADLVFDDFRGDFFRVGFAERTLGADAACICAYSRARTAASSLFPAASAALRAAPI